MQLPLPPQKKNEPNAKDPGQNLSSFKYLWLRLVFSLFLQVNSIFFFMVAFYFQVACTVRA
jgi:hypothetical protein